MGRDLRRPAGPLFAATLMATLVAIAAGALLGELDLAPSWPAHGWLVTLALTSQVVGWLLIALALPRLPASLTSIVLTVQPVGSVLLGIVLLGEEPAPLQLAGVALIVARHRRGDAPGPREPTFERRVDGDDRCSCAPRSKGKHCRSSIGAPPAWGAPSLGRRPRGHYRPSADDRQRSGRRRAGRAANAARPLHPRRARLDRHAHRLRHLQLRSVHLPRRRRVRQELHRPGRPGRRAEVTTIEGMVDADGGLHPLQEAFWANHGLQCGYCTPGMIMAAADLIARHGPGPISEEEVRHGIEGNLCRCTGYHNIVKAVQAAAEAMGKVTA